MQMLAEAMAAAFKKGNEGCFVCGDKSRNLGSETQTMQMLAEAMAAAFKKGNEGCFVCGDKSHLKKNCPKKHTEKIKTTKKPPGVFPQCHKGVH